MKSYKSIVTGILLLMVSTVFAGPEDDRKAFQKYYQERFPEVPFDDFANGIYAIDLDARQQWQDIEEFPPYVFDIDEGESLWNIPFPDGTMYTDCFSGQTAIRHLYPQFDSQLGEVVTLERAINLCREQHSQPALKYNGKAMIGLSSYVAFKSRGKVLNITVEENIPAAIQAYEAGKRFYYSKRGQLNFACSDCHVTSVGQYVRAEHLGPSLGQPTHFPVYRSKVGRTISLHKRVAGCMKNIRAKPLKLQGEEYRNLEYFLTYMSNGLKVNGPGSRK